MSSQTLAPTATLLRLEQRGHYCPSGGFISQNAEVHPGAYVGPDAVVLSGYVGEHVRLEGNTLIIGGHLTSPRPDDNIVATTIKDSQLSDVRAKDGCRITGSRIVSGTFEGFAEVDDSVMIRSSANAAKITNCDVRRVAIGGGTLLGVAVWTRDADPSSLSESGPRGELTKALITPRSFQAESSKNVMVHPRAAITS